MKRYIIAIVGLMLCCGLRAQTRTCRYWFDGNLGQSVTTIFSGNVWDAEIDVSQLADGIHSLHYYMTDTTSTPVRGYLFHKISTVPTSELRYNYWFDNHQNNMQSGTLGNGTFLLDVSGLGTGVHTLHLILKGSNFSSTRSYLFIKTEMADLGVNLSYHCWFDEDFGHQQTGVLGDGNLLLNVSGLEDGEHIVRIFLEGSNVAATQSYIFVKGGDAEIYEITAMAMPADGGTITGAGSYYADNICTLTATPNAGYSFVCWKENGSIVSEQASYTFTVNGNRNLVAQFSGTGVEEYEDESIIALYPNPVEEKLVAKSLVAIRQCEVYSISGQLILSVTNCSDRLEVPVEGLPQGVYLVKMVTDKFVRTKKFVKK